MKNISRRSVLKHLTNMTLIAAAAPLASTLGCSADRRITLNVILHGLFVLNFNDHCIELLTPNVGEHVYYAGNWDKDEIEPLIEGGRYGLRGVDHNDSPLLPTANNIHLCQDIDGFTVHSERSYYITTLPFPKEIRLLRLVNPIDPSSETCIKSQGTSRSITCFSLCQALIYPVTDYRALELTGASWEPAIDEATSTANLHFWAEPIKRLNPDHANHAYAALSDLIPPLQLTLGTNRTSPLDPDTGICGLSSEEEQGLSEWMNGGETSYPTNCNAVMVTKNVMVMKK